MANLAALLTVHNRKAKTLACLNALFRQQGLPQDVNMQVLLVDDGCTDGTTQAIQSQFPTVRILPGTGDLFWCGGMRLAFGAAMRDGFDFYLWLNDDTILFPDALTRTLATSAKFNHQAIIVASIQDPQSGALTYGGVKRTSPRRPTQFSRIHPSEQPLPAEAMNGNCVLIPSIVAQKVGNLDSTFTHGIGDYDYGLRAKQMGLNIIVASGYYGYCPRNLPDRKQSWPKYLKWMFSPHGLPFYEWAVFTRRYAGPLWVIFYLSSYIKLLKEKVDDEIKHFYKQSLSKTS